MQTNEVKTKRVHNLIIVDESGSMEVIRKQAFVGMNETLQTVRKMQEKFPDQEQYVTLLTFDSGHTTWHYDNLPAALTKDLDWKAYCPGLRIWTGRPTAQVAAHLSTMLLARESPKLTPKLRMATTCW